MKFPQLLQVQVNYTKNVGDELGVSELKTVLGLEAYDDYDGNITNNLFIQEDHYTGNENVVGEHIVIYQAADSSNNTASFTATIKVKIMKVLFYGRE